VSWTTSNAVGRDCSNVRYAYAPSGGSGGAPVRLVGGSARDGTGEQLTMVEHSVDLSWAHTQSAVACGSRDLGDRLLVTAGSFCPVGCTATASGAMRKFRSNLPLRVIDRSIFDGIACGSRHGWSEERKLRVPGTSASSIVTGSWSFLATSDTGSTLAARAVFAAMGAEIASSDAANQGPSAPVRFALHGGDATYLCSRQQLCHH